MMQLSNKLRKITQNSSQWSHLPQQFLLRIVVFLRKQSPSDLVRFQLVCKNWYVSCWSITSNVLSDNLPRKITIIPPFFVLRKYPVYFVGTSVFLVQPLNQQSTQPWLVSVEELNHGKLKVHYPLTKKPIKDLPLNFPEKMDLSGFRVVLIHRGLKVCYENGCQDVVEVNENSRWYGLLGRTKVILVADDDDCVAIMLVIRGCGSLMSFNPSTGACGELKLGRVSCFDDIVCFKGLIYAVDRKGRLYPIDVDGVANVGNEIAYGVCDALAFDARKRLVVLDEELYMINRNSKKFEVYKLNVGLGKWDEVSSLGDQIVFVTLDDVFAVNASEFPRCRGNCILFSKQCFPNYMGQCCFEKKLFYRAKEYLEVGVYYLGDDCPWPIASYPELCDLFWPFPSWLCSDSSKVSREVGKHQSNSSRLTAKNGIPDQNNDKSGQAVNSRPEIPVSDSFTKTLQSLFTTCDELREPVPKIIGLDTIPVIDSLDESAENVEKFEGVNVSSCFIPVLQRVRNKHGNIILGNTDEVKSDSLLLKYGLETLAKMVEILQSNSVHSLTDSDAKFLDASLHDLKFMRFNVAVVDWLVPLVKSALDHYQESRSG